MVPCVNMVDSVGELVDFLFNLKLRHQILL